jgi:cell division protease FtsH
MGKQAIRVWVALLAVFALFMLLRPPTGLVGEEKRVGASEFIARVEAGDVAMVEISGPEYRGKLQSPKGASIVTYSDASREEIVRALKAKKVPFEEKQPSPWMGLLMSLLPFLLLIVLFMFMVRGIGNAGRNVAQTFGSAKSKVHQPNSKNKVTFADVAGVDEVKEEVKELVDFLKDPKKFSRLGARTPKGVLLMGPPGTGKTLIARAVAGEAGVPFIEGSASEFVEMFVGVGASRIRDLFEQGRKNAPCIIFIDELDAVGKQRGGIRSIGGHDEREQTLNQLLTEMDGFTPNDGLIVIGATNQPEVLDQALLRAGRFDRQVVVPRPDVKGREAILKVHARKIPLMEGVELSRIARGTPGMTGADLENLLNEAALRAGKLGKPQVDESDIWYARDKVLMGPERKSAIMSDEERKVIAVHEGGHTIVGWLTPGADPVQKMTIIPRGRALGLTVSLPLGDRFLSSRERLLGEVRMLLGGRAAEYLVNGPDKITTGASNDLERAGDIIDKMVVEWGMSELGLLTYRKRAMTFLGERDGGLDCSDEMAAKIDQAKAKMLDEQWKAVLELVGEHREQLRSLTAAAIEKETLEEEDIEAILGPRPK